MKRAQPFAIGCIALLAGAAVATVYVWLEIYRPLRAALECGLTVKEEIPSPNQDFFAVVFEKDCGATTEASTQVGIQKTAARLSTSDLDPFVIVHGDHRPPITRLDDKRIAIALPRSEKIYRRYFLTDGVSVTYR